MEFYIIFRQSAEVSGILFFWRVCYNCIPRVHRNTLEKRIFSKTYIFPMFSDKNRFFFQTLLEKIRRECQNWNLQVQKKFWDKFFYKGSSILFWIVGKNISRLCNENPGVVVKSGFSFSDETFGEKCFSMQSLQFVTFFWKSSRKISAGCRKKISGAFNLLSSSPWEQFVESIFRKLLHPLWTFFRIFSGNWAGKGRPVKAAFFVSIETFGKESCFGK